MAHRSRTLPLLGTSCRCSNASLRTRLADRVLAAPFSSTSHSAAGASASGPKRGVKANKAGNKKKKRQLQRMEKPRPPAEGERRAFRKRVVLSNVNALEVAGLADLDAETAITPELQGRMLGVPGPLVDQLRAAEAFKPRQSWGMFRRPAVLVRAETVALAQAMADSGTAGGMQRRIVVGERGSGKSVLLLQAMALAFVRGWVVISIPEGKPAPPAAWPGRD